MNNLETAYVLVQSKVAHEMEVMSEILKLDDVKEVKEHLAFMIFLSRLKQNLPKKLKKLLPKKFV